MCLISIQKLISLRWSFLCCVDGTETSALTPAAKAVKKLTEEKEQKGFHCEVLFFERPGCCGGTWVFFWAVCFAT